MFLVPQQAIRAFVCVTVSLTVLFSAGCGNNYRPVVSAINPVGPSTQPTVYAVAVSDPGTGRNGLVTVIDVFGDTIIANAFVAPEPSYVAVDPTGTTYVLHSDSVLVDSFSAAPGLMTTTVRQSSLGAGNCPALSTGLTCSINPGASGSPLYITRPGVNTVSVLTDQAPPTARQDLPVPANPVYTVGNGGGPRVYTLSQGTTPGTSTGIATAIENGANNVISASIPVGISPVYGVMTADDRRAFVINKGAAGTNGTVSVLDVQANALDRTVNVGVNPVWASIAPAVNELAVLNAGNGTAAGSLSIINLALCSQVALPGNTACDPNNPTDSANFGKILATIPVGAGPVQVAVTSDLSKAYVANATDGTVTVVDMNTMVATSTIKVGGHLNWITAVGGSPTGKVLVTASDTQTLTIIRTDNDTVSTTLSLQGNAIAVRIEQAGQ